MHRTLRAGATAGLLMLSTACTGTGLNAGEQGGEAFIVFAIMLVLMCVVMWLILGRSE